jgi:hypothetical protein
MLPWQDMHAEDAAARPLSLSALAAYLLVAGWTMMDQDHRTSMWRSDLAGDDQRLVLPVDQEVTDYGERIYDALRLLAYVERRSLDEIASDISFGPADTVAIRLTPDTPSGQAPLSLAYEAVSALRSYVIGSGAALEDQSLVLPARRSRQAEVYANAARFATQPGSFIMSLSLPLEETSTGEDPHGDPTEKEIEEKSPEGVQGTLIDVSPQPFGRLVANRMAAAARYARSLAEEVNEGHREISVFGKPTAGAANATELEALSGLGGAQKSPYQIRFAQSPLAPQRLKPTTLRITPGQQRVMADAAEYLRTKQARTNITVEGSVIHLSRERMFGPGEVVVYGIIDDSGRARRFHIKLTPEDYNEALRAHTQGLRVIVRGDLDTRGTWKWIRPVRAFVIVPGLSENDD